MGRSRDHLRGCKHDEAGVSGEGRAAQARRSGCVPGHPNGCHQKPRLFPRRLQRGQTTSQAKAQRGLRQTEHGAGAVPRPDSRPLPRSGPPRRSAVGGVRGEASALGPPRRGHGLNPGTEPSDWRVAAGTGGAGREAGPAPGRCRFGVEPRTPRLVAPHPSFQRPARKRPRLGGGGAAREPAGSPPWRSGDTARAPPSGARPGPLRPPRHEHHGPQSAALGPWLFPLAQSP